MEDKIIFDIGLELDREDFYNMKDASDIAKIMKVTRATIRFQEDGEEVVMELTEEEILEKVKEIFEEAQPLLFSSRYLLGL